MRLAMRHLCKYTAKQATVFASQSLRRGGDAHLWKNGATKDVHMALGSWKTPKVEIGDLEMELEEHLQIDEQLRSSVASCSSGRFGLGGTAMPPHPFVRL